jgi:predicted translin family RNA/ssDNA-binding protein
MDELQKENKKLIKEVESLKKSLNEYKKLYISIWEKENL